MDKKKLYQDFLDGNIRAFDEIVSTYKNGLIAFIARYIKDIEIAEDISQEVFVDIYINKEKYNFKFSLKTYLYTIGKYKAIDYLKKMKSYETIENLEIVNEKNTEDEILLYESNMNVVNTLKKLKKNYEIAVYLADIENLSYKEIAKITKSSIPQVKVTIYRARKALKKIIEKEECFNA